MTMTWIRKIAEEKVPKNSGGIRERNSACVAATRHRQADSNLDWEGNFDFLYILQSTGRRLKISLTVSRRAAELFEDEDEKTILR